MIKYICDICKNEMDINAPHGEMMVQESSFGFLKHQKVPNIRQVSYLFCQKCSENMREQKKALERSFNTNAENPKS